MLKTFESNRLICYSSTRYVMAIYNIDLNSIDLVDLENENNTYAQLKVFSDFT